jgi:serine/threonine protein phosphatase PrpC
MDVAYRTEVGHVRSRNEDAVLARPERGVLAVAGAAHQAVLDAAAAEPDRTGMGTTLVLAAVSDDAALVLHVGDSRAYLLAADGELSAVTDDHGMHGYLTQALGLDRDIAPDVAHVECPPGSRLLLCTDGLTNMVDDARLTELLGRGSAQEACDSLVEAALDAGGVDNVTVVVVAF